MKAALSAIFLSAFLFALTLAASPQLHEQLHDAGAPNHECVVTMLSLGSCDHAPPPIAACKFFAENAQPIDSLGRTEIFSRSEFSKLEHAPPVCS